MTLYRNLKLEHLLDANNFCLFKIFIKRMIIDKGYMEASIHKLDKMYDNDTQLIIKVKKNTNCLLVAAYTHRVEEMGILFPRDTKLKIRKIRRILWNKWKWKIYCEVI